MPDESIPYRNREIKEMIDDVRNSLQRIEVQTTTTNGRVSKLENWKHFITGGMTVITLIIVPLLGWALWVLANIQGQVHNAVDSALSAYQIEK